MYNNSGFGHQARVLYLMPAGFPQPISNQIIYLNPALQRGYGQFTGA